MAEKQAGRPPISWSFNYHDLARISGKSLNAVQRQRTREGGFDPENFESVLFWCVRNARPELKQELLIYALSYHLTDRSESEKPAKRKASKKKTAKKKPKRD